MSVISWETKMKIELEQSQVNSLVVEEMKEHSRLLRSLEAKLRRKKRLLDYERDDLKRYRDVLAAMKVIVGYYDSPSV